MNIDKETEIESLWITFPNSTKLGKQLRENHKEWCGDEDGFLITEELGKIKTDEYYVEEDDSKLNIHYSCNIETENGDIYASFDIPLSDEILLDILSHSLERLDKLREAIKLLK